MFSAILFTEERIFFFDSLVADELQKQLSPESAASGFYTMVSQVPLQNVESVAFRPACQQFPNGSVLVRFRSSDAFLARVSAFTEVLDERDPEIAEKIRNDFSPVQENELGLPCAHTREDYRRSCPRWNIWRSSVISALWTICSRGPRPLDWIGYLLAAKKQRTIPYLLSRKENHNDFCKNLWTASYIPLS